MNRVPHRCVQALPEPSLWEQTKAFVLRKPVQQVQVPLVTISRAVAAHAVAASLCGNVMLL